MFIRVFRILHGRRKVHFGLGTSPLKYLITTLLKTFKLNNRLFSNNLFQIISTIIMYYNAISMQIYKNTLILMQKGNLILKILNFLQFSQKQFNQWVYSLHWYPPNHQFVVELTFSWQRKLGLMNCGWPKLSSLATAPTVGTNSQPANELSICKLYALRTAHHLAVHLPHLWSNVRKGII